jgi:hypothetical protein
MRSYDRVSHRFEFRSVVIGRNRVRQANDDAPLAFGL